ncbi:MAG: serpin family protein, partial [Ruminococcaceae bacterium]|nr:serpin family protein [Oscillospiraceae bacterium]
LYDFLFDMKKTGKGYFVNLSVPKFDVTTQTDLISGLQKLGITDAFSEDKADFTPLHGDEVSSYVGRADNAVRVSINEKGVSAASFVMTANPGTGAFMGTEEIDFVLDRPFLFVIERNTLPLFCGIVNQP